MIRYLWRTLAARFRGGRMLFLLTLFGVALGVASVLSIQIIHRNALGSFEGSLRAVSGDADFSIVSKLTTFPEKLYPEVLAQPGVAAAWPLYRIDVALHGEEDQYVDIVGFDLFAPLRIPWEEAPQGGLASVQEGGWVAVSPRFAERLGLQQGDSFDVSSGSRLHTLRIGALVDFRKVSPLAGSRLVVMDIAQAQSLFGGRGQLSQIEVVADADVDIEALRESLEARLGQGVVTLSPEQRTALAADLLGAFRLNLTALSLISLVVGGFLVYTSTQAALVRRRNEFGLLRAEGVTRGRVAAVILSEVALTGVLGTLAGFPLGYLAAVWNVDRVSATLSNLYLLEAIETLQLPAGLYVLAAAVGLGGALLGALPPTLEAIRADPRDLLAAFTLQERFGSAARRMFAAGLAALAVGAGGWWFLLREARSGGFVVGIGLLIALPLCAPMVVRAGTRAIGVTGFGLRYGAKALGLKLQSAAFAVAALAIAVTMLVGVTMMISSFRRTVEIWLDATLQADVYVTTESWRRARDSATLDDTTVARLERREGVRHVDRLRSFTVESRGRSIGMAGVDIALPVAGRFSMIDGDPDAALRAVADDGHVLISEPLARKDRLGVGDDLVVDGPAGELRFPIAGVFHDYSSEVGGAVMDLDTLEDAFGPGQVSNLALYLDPEQDAEALASSLRLEFAGRPLMFRSNRDIRGEVFRIFDQTFAITRLLQGMSLLIAVAGVTLTLIVLARERVGELALYRALGATRRQIFRVFLGKGLGIAGFGLALGLPAGIGLALILIFVINRAFFGWTIALHWSFGALLEGAALILAASVLASLYPALRASRTPATELTRENL